MAGLINQTMKEKQPDNAQMAGGSGGPDGKMLAPGVPQPGSRVDPGQQKVFNRFEINTMNMLYGEKSFDGFVGLLDKGKPVGSVALAASKLINESRKATVQKGGKPVTPEMTANVANIAVGELAVIAEKSNLFTLTPEQKRKSLDLVIGSEYKKDVKRGVIDPTKYKQFLQQNGALQNIQTQSGGQS